MNREKEGPKIAEHAANRDGHGLPLVPNIPKPALVRFPHFIIQAGVDRVF